MSSTLFGGHFRLVGRSGRDSCAPLTGGGLENQQSKCGNYFFEWTGNRLRQVKFIPGKRNDRP